ncbi:testis expressed 19 [Phyllostomus discolor]|uniref:Testis expressed 19 n=1 Tax=Phyllostomus discolor TaxID=89673 RepID=A0A6J2M750_9CHIR|nr:testis-expressed protein 19 [Phyllostomus discolor]KAF6097620.1 testis expressed 19 [Phyllostomus discolor]
MCPPVSARPGREGVSHLYASWRYQLQHGDQLRICFMCFKFVFLSFKEALESEDWEDEEWDPEFLESPVEGAGWGQALGQAAAGVSADWSSDSLESTPDESAEGGLDQYFVPTELNPQDAAPLGLGPEDADWTQGLPWRFGGILACCHWPSPYFLWQAFLKEVLPPGEPMLLELGTTRAVDPAEAEDWLLGLQVMSMVDDSDGTYLRNMTALWALRTPGQGWNVLLEPDDVCVVKLQSSPPGQDLNPWKLSILETSETGYGVELVPADTALLRRGFSILSYSPWSKKEAEESDPASGPEPSAQGQGPSVAGTGEGPCPGPGAAALFPAPPPKARK